MSDIVSSKNSPASSGSGNSPIRQRLRSFRHKILLWLSVNGLSRLALAIVVVAAIDFLIDWTFRMDLAQRTIMLVLIVGLFLYVIYRYLIKPFQHKPSDDALCLQVEERHSELGQGIISAIQFSRIDDLDRLGVSPSMVAATIAQGEQAAEQVDFGTALNRDRFVFNCGLLVAMVSLLALGGVAVANNETMNTWFDRNVMLGASEWPRDTYLKLEGINEDGEVVVLRGEDHLQLVTVTEDSVVSDVEIVIEFKQSGGRATQKMQPNGELDGRQHELVFRNVNNEFDFRATGGDAVTPWAHVSLVDPPEVAELELIAYPPAYTGAESIRFATGRGPYQVVEGSRMSVRGKANKQLSAARLTHNGQSWDFELKDGIVFSLEIPADRLESGKYAFVLADELGRSSTRPSSFAISLTKDRTPRVRASLMGVSGMVVPRARVPFEVSASDDYQISRFLLRYNWRGESVESVPQKGESEFERANDQLGNDEVVFGDVLDLEPYQIPPGAGLKFTFSAFDNDEYSGNKEGTSTEFLLRIVTEEELRTDLLRREKEQRQEFEKTLKQQIELQTEIQAMLADLNDEQSGETARTRLAGLLRFRQQQKLLGTNVGSIASTLEEYLTEAMNNRLDEESGSFRRRLGTQIILPMRIVDEEMIQFAIRHFDASRRSVNDPTQLAENLELTIDQQTEIIIQMEEILRFMAKEESFQEMVNLLYEIEKTQKKVLEMTSKEHEERLKRIFESGNIDFKALD